MAEKEDKSCHYGLRKQSLSYEAPECLEFIVFLKSESSNLKFEKFSFNPELDSETLNERRELIEALFPKKPEIDFSIEHPKPRPENSKKMSKLEWSSSLAHGLSNLPVFGLFFS